MSRRYSGNMLGVGLGCLKRRKKSVEKNPGFRLNVYLGEGGGWWLVHENERAEEKSAA